MCGVFSDVVLVPARREMNDGLVVAFLNEQILEKSYLI